jgi:hypothetical protein
LERHLKEQLAMATKKRELVDTGTDKRYVRRDDQGQFTNDQVDVGRSLSDDRRQHSNTVAKPGHGDRGDRPKSS